MAVMTRTGTVTRVLPHGTNSQSPAVQHLIGTVFGGLSQPPKATRKRRRRKAAVSAAPRKRKRRSRSKQLVKGSAAAKRRMAALRKMRKAA